MNRKKLSGYNCIECPDNKNSCPICPELNTCKECPICKTKQKQPCKHCPVSCQYELKCTIRKEWIGTSIDIMDDTRVDCTNNDVCFLDGECPQNRMMHEDGEFEECISCSMYNVACKSENITPDKGCFLKFEPNIYSPDTTTMTNKHNHTPTTMDLSTSTAYSKNRKSGSNTSSFAKGVWDSGITCIKECPHKTESIELIITLDVYTKLIYLQDKYSDTEFTVFGNAILQQDDSYLLSDITIPKQTVAHSSVDDIEIDGVYNVIIHKHPGDNPGGFSTVDEEYANQNHDISILIGSKNLDTYVAVARKLTKCGCYIRVPISIKTLRNTITDKFFLDSVEKNITKKIYQNNTNVRDWKNNIYFG